MGKQARGTPDWPWADIVRWVSAEAERAGRRYRLDPGEVAELRQRASLRVMESLPRFDPADGSASLETWVRRHSVWSIADYWRERLRRERTEGASSADMELVGSTPAPEREAQRSALRGALEVCYEKLTPTQRERFEATQKALDARATLSGVARALGISRDSLKESVGRARVLLRRCLDRAGFSPSSDDSAPPTSAAPAV